VDGRFRSGNHREQQEQGEVEEGGNKQGHRKGRAAVWAAAAGGSKVITGETAAPSNTACLPGSWTLLVPSLPDRTHLLQGLQCLLHSYADKKMASARSLGSQSNQPCRIKHVAEVKNASHCMTCHDCGILVGNSQIIMNTVPPTFHRFAVRETDWWRRQESVSNRVVGESNGAAGSPNDGVGGPNEAVACPNRQVRPPNSPVASPNRADEDPNRSVALPNRRVGCSNRSVAAPNGVVVHPNGPVEGPNPPVGGSFRVSHRFRATTD
jgi:hypothetical protein